MAVSNSDEGRYGALFFGRDTGAYPCKHGQTGLSHGRWEDLYCTSV